MNKMVDIACLVALSMISCTTTAQQRAKYTVLLSEENVENAYPRLSSDGKSILYQSNKGGKWHLYIMDIASKKARQITSGESNNNFPDWDSKNEWVAFVSDRDGNEEIYTTKLDGSELKRITNDPQRDIHPYFSPDGQYLLFNSTRGNGSLDIYRYSIATGKTERITNTEDNETCARYSPDMINIVYLRNSDINDDVFTMDMSTMLTTNITNDPTVRDGWPVYSSNGKWIYYSSMSDGPFNIYRIKPDGTGRQRISSAEPSEEDARAFISAGDKMLVYNKRKEGRIDINLIELEQLP